MAKKTEKELREKMEEAIDSIHKIVIEEDNGHKQVQAANALSGLIRSYKEMFGAVPEEAGKMKAVKNF